MEIKPRYIIILVVVIAIVVFLSGYISKPSTELVERPISTEYYGKIQGTFQGSPEGNITGRIYDGNLSGFLDGQIERNATLRDARVNITGSYTGELYGIYEIRNKTIYYQNGFIRGILRGRIDGNEFVLQQTGLKIPTWLIWLSVFSFLLLLLKYLGILDRIIDVIFKKEEGEIKKPYHEIAEGLYSYFNNNTDTHFNLQIQEVLDNVWHPEKSPTRIFFLVRDNEGKYDRIEYQNEQFRMRERDISLLEWKAMKQQFREDSKLERMSFKGITPESIQEMIKAGSAK